MRHYQELLGFQNQSHLLCLDIASLSQQTELAFYSSSFFRILAGFPATMALSGTSFVTTEPAPTIEFFPIVMPPNMVALAPIEAPFLTIVFSGFQSLPISFNFPFTVALGILSFTKQACGPTKTSSSRITPCGRNANACILQFFPIFTLSLISTKLPILVLSPISQP